MSDTIMQNGAEQASKDFGVKVNFRGPDKFSIPGTMTHAEITPEQLEKTMAGGKELGRLASEFQRAKVAA